MIGKGRKRGAQPKTAQESQADCTCAMEVGSSG